MYTEVTTFPPGVSIPKDIHDNLTIDQMTEVEEYILDQGITQEENDARYEDNMFAMLTYLSGGSRDAALQGMDEEDLSEFEDCCNMWEEYHQLLANSPQGTGHYLYQMGNGMVFYGFGNAAGQDLQAKVKRVPDGEPAPLPRRKETSEKGVKELTVRDRVTVDARLYKVGANYMVLVCKYGKIYCDLRFSKYIKGGKGMKCVAAVTGPHFQLPLKCLRVI